MVSMPTDGLNPLYADKFRTPLWADDAPERLQIEADLDVREWVRMVDRAVEELDFGPLCASYSGRGRKAYRPDLLLRLVFYEIHNGCRCPCRWVEHLRRDPEVRWLVRGIRPGKSILYEFYDRIFPFLEAYHQQVIASIQKWCVENDCGDLTAETVLDGSSLEANASRHKMLCLDSVDKHLEQLEKAQQGVEPSAVEPSAERPKWMAKTYAGRQRQIKHHRRAKERLEEQLAKNSRRAKDKQLARKNVRLSITDPEAASGRDKHNVYRPLYNLQLIWSLVAPVILTFDVFQEHGDHGMLPILIDKLASQLNQKPKMMLVDSAYTTADDLAFCQLHGIDLYGPWQENKFTKDRPARANPKQIPKERFVYDAASDSYRCPQGHALPFADYKYRRRADGSNARYQLYRCPPQHCRVCPLAAHCAKLPHKGRTIQRHPQQELIDAHQARMATPEAKQRYRQRGQGERPFADLKTHRNLQRLRGRGLQRAKTEIGLAVLIHNLEVLRTLKTSALKETQLPNPCKIPA